MKPGKIALLWAMAITLLTVSGCKFNEPEQAPAETVVTVRTAPVAEGESIAEPLRFAGIVQARQRATLTFQMSGTLRERAVELGEHVGKGQVLAQLYNPRLAPAKASAEARLQELSTQLEQAQREVERSRQLREKGVVSEQALEQITARRDGLMSSVATARAALFEATQMESESILRAPFAGRVVALLVEKDEFVAAGQPVLKLSSPEGREVEIRVPAYLLSQVAVGDEVPVWSVQDRRQAPAAGQVSEVAQAGAERGQLHQVLVALPDAAFTPGVGEPVEVGVTPRIQGQISVPILSVIRSSTGTSVFRISGDTARRVPVSVHRIIGEQVVVSSDILVAGEQVVYAGLTRLADGDRVEILP